MATGIEIDIPEISSTSSKEQNQRAFYKKLRSRKYKCILSVVMTGISFFIIIWLALLVRGIMLLLQELNLDLPYLVAAITSMQRLHNVTTTSSSFM